MAAKKATPKKATAASAAKKSSTKKASASASSTKKKTTAKKATAKTGDAKLAARLVVREGESPWTAAEVKEIRDELEGEVRRLSEEVSSGETDLSEFLKEPIDGAGDDPADAGSKSFEREHELSLAASTRAGLQQNVHALERLGDGSYGQCESCGEPIGKARLQAYPRATLCLACKSKQERR